MNPQKLAAPQTTPPRPLERGLGGEAVEAIKPYSEQGSKSEQVTCMFDHIAHSYDLLNHALSLGIDRRWRREAIDRLGEHHPQHILDIATGTGDFALLAADRIKPRSIIGADLSEGMMEVARQKVAQWEEENDRNPKQPKIPKIPTQPKNPTKITFQREDCTRLTFPDATFDAVTSSYGVRNFQDLEAGLREMHRVLRPGGHLLIIELTPPPHFPMRQLFWLYSKVVMPLIGRLISGDDSAYTYLPQSMYAFPQAETLAPILKDKIGFSRVEWKRFTFGISTMYLAEK